jgi:hypothetical protein
MGCGDACAHVNSKNLRDWDLPDPHGQVILSKNIVVFDEP